MKILQIVESDVVSRNGTHLQRVIFSDDKIVYVTREGEIRSNGKEIKSEHISLITTYNASHGVWNDDGKISENPRNKSLVGISGVLTLLVITLMISGLMCLYDILYVFLIDGGISSDNVLGEYIVFALFCDLLGIILSTLSVIFIFMRKRIVKILVTMYAIFTMVIAFIVSIWVTNLCIAAGVAGSPCTDPIPMIVIKAIIWAAIWIPCVWSSKRAKATLTER